MKKRLKKKIALQNLEITELYEDINILLHKHTPEEEQIIRVKMNIKNTLEALLLTGNSVINEAKGIKSVI